MEIDPTARSGDARWATAMGALGKWVYPFQTDICMVRTLNNDGKWVNTEGGFLESPLTSGHSPKVWYLYEKFMVPKPKPSLNEVEEEAVDRTTTTSFHDMAPDVFDVIPDLLRFNGGTFEIQDNGIGKRSVKFNGNEVPKCYRLVIDMDACDLTRVRLYLYPDYPKKEKEDVG